MAQVIGFQIVIDGLGKTVETATELKRAIADVNAELKKTTDVQEIKKLEAKLVDLKAAQMEVNKVVKEQIKSRNEEITATDKANGAYRKLSKELNDQRNRYKDLAAAEQESSQEAKDLLVSINNLDKKLKGIDATVGQFQRNVGGYTEALGQFFPKLGGTIGNVTGLVGDLSSGFANLGKTTGAANIGLGAVGLALTAFNAISGIIGDLNQAAKEINELKLQLENFGVASENLNLVSSRAKSIGEVFQTNADDIAVAANTLKNEFGVSFEEAFKIIEDGFIKGANGNKQFVENLKEFPAQFKKAGLSAEEFLAISIDSADKGVFSNKALDAVKEFGTAVTEQLSGTREAFIGAFGEEFTSKLFNDLNSGAVSSGQALKLVTEEIKTTGVSGKELQSLISTVFTGAGEDAGNYVLTLGDAITNTDKLKAADSNLQKQVRENLKVTQSNNLATATYSESVAEAEIRRKEFSDGLSKLGKVLFDVVIFFVQPLLSAFNSVVDGFSKGYDAIKFIADEGSAIISKSFSKNSEKELNATIAANKKKLDAEKKIQDDINKVGGKAFLEREAKAEKIREAALNKSKADAALLLKTEDGLNQAIADKKAKRGSLVFGTPEFKKVESEIKKLEKELEKFNPSKAGSKGGEKFVKSFTDGSLAELENQRSELQSAFSNAVVGSDTQKGIAVKLNEVNTQIKTAVETQNEILGLNAEKKKQNAIDEINQNFKIAQSVIELERIKSDLSLNEIEDIKEKRFILNDDYNAEIQRIDALIALEEAGSKQIENLLVERRAAEANYIKGKDGITKQEEQINNNRLAAEKKFNKLIAQGDIDAIKDETERQIAAAKQKLADDLENLEKDKDFILLSELEKAKLRKLLVGKTEDEIADLIEQKAKIELDKRKENAQKLIDGIAESILSVTDIIATFQQARAEKEAEAINEQITNTENNITELEAKAEKASGIRKKRIERDIASQKELLKQQQAEAEAIRIKAAKEEKRIAIIQAIIQGALAFQRALAQGSFLLAIPTGIAAAAQIATIAAQPLAEGGVVTGQRVNQKQNIPTRSNGDNVLAYVKRGEVVLNQRQQSLLGGSPTFRRLGIKGFAEGGMVPPISPPIQGISLQGNMNEFLQVMEAKTDAINNRIDRLQAYVVSEDIARDLAEGNKLKINATL